MDKQKLLNDAKLGNVLAFESLDYIMGNAFSMIPKESVLKQNTSLDVLKSTVVTLKDVLATTKKSIRLAIQFI